MYEDTSEALMVGLLFVFLPHKREVGTIHNPQHGNQEPQQGILQSKLEVATGGRFGHILLLGLFESW